MDTVDHSTTENLHLAVLKVIYNGKWQQPEDSSAIDSKYATDSLRCMPTVRMPTHLNQTFKIIDE